MSGTDPKPRSARLVATPLDHQPSPLFVLTEQRALLRYQGAEALVYQTHFLTPCYGLPAALKHRRSKSYRHHALDARLTRHRILAEARVLVRLRREGVAVPALYALDCDQGWILMEWIDGSTVRTVLDEIMPSFVAEGGDMLEEITKGEDKAELGRLDVRSLMAKIGKVVGRMHEVGVVHGDLTTSNLMLRTPRNPESSRNLQILDGEDASNGGGKRVATTRHKQDCEIVIIDFGLVVTSIQDEDRAVDLYVLERAFGSTHPRTEDLFQEVLNAYKASYKGAMVVLKKYEAVRMRGRKKIMIG